MRRHGTWMALAAMALAIAIATGSWEARAQGPGKVRIGVLLPLSGPIAVGGQLVRRGYEMAAEDINKAGGIKSLEGAQVELIFGDHQARQDVAIGETERLIEREKVVAIMGAYHSPATVAATTASERLRTPWIVEVAAADAILERGFKYVTRVNVKASWYGEAPVDFLDHAKAKLGQKVQRVAIMYGDDDWGRSAVGKGTKEALKKRGYQIVEEVVFPPPLQDATSYINRVKAAKPDAFIVTAFPNDALLIARAVEQLGLKVPIAVGVSSGHVLPTFRSNLGPMAERWFVVGGWNPDIPGAKPLADRFKGKYNVDMSEHVTLAYQTTWVLKEAIEQAKSVDRDKINDALHRIKIEPGPLMVMPFEKIEFDATGQNPHARELMLQILAGQLVTVWPEKYAPHKPVFPFR
jgi:branched-chain amino acid transport system substrate-binding protein